MPRIINANIERKYPHIYFRLVGTSSTAYNVLKRAFKLMEEENISEENIRLFEREACSGNYDKLLCTCMCYFSVF